VNRKVKTNRVLAQGKHVGDRAQRDAAGRNEQQLAGCWLLAAGC